MTARSSRAVEVLVDRLETPLGPMFAAATSDALLLLEFEDRRTVPMQVGRIARALGCVFIPGRPAVLDQTQAQLSEYFNGTRREFDVPLLTPGTTFQRSVYKLLSQHGERLSLFRRLSAARHSDLHFACTCHATAIYDETLMMRRRISAS